MKILMNVLKLIPVKTLAKFAPEVIAFILSKVMKWLSEKKPEKLKAVIQTTEDILKALDITLEAGSDNVFTPKEVKQISEAWKNAFD